MLRYNNAWGRVNENDADIEQHLDRMYNRRIIDEWNGQFSLTNDEQIGGGIRVQGVVDMMTPVMVSNPCWFYIIAILTPLT